MCTLIGRRDPRGDSSFLASTSDDPYTVRNHVVVRSPAAGLRYVGTVVTLAAGEAPWGGMVSRAMNEAGLAFTFSFVNPSPETETKTTATGDAVAFSEGLAGRARTVVEALRYLRGGVPSGATGNYLLLDAQGTLAVVEASLDRTAVQRTDTVACTNRWSNASMPRHAPSVYSAPTSARRQARALELLVNTKTTGIDLALSVLRDHAGQKGGAPEYTDAICNHGRTDGTISSEVIVPHQRTFLYRYGRPCGEDREGLRAWPGYLALRLAELPDGALTTTDGSLTQAAVASGLCIAPTTLGGLP